MPPILMTTVLWGNTSTSHKLKERRGTHFQVVRSLVDELQPLVGQVSGGDVTHLVPDVVDHLLQAVRVIQQGVHALATLCVRKQRTSVNCAVCTFRRQEVKTAPMYIWSLLSCKALG